MSVASREAWFDGGFAVMPDGARLPVKAWKADVPKAVIVATHGYNNTHGEFEVFGPAPWFAVRSVTFYAFDQRGFGNAPMRGRWAGATRMARDVAALARLAQAMHPGVPVYVLGQSMGGAVTILATALRDMPDVAGVILAAPGLRGWEQMSFARQLGLRLTAWLKPDEPIPAGAQAWKGTDNEALEVAFDNDPARLHQSAYGTISGLAGMMSKARRLAPRIRVPVLFVYGAHDHAITKASVAPIVRKMREANVPMVFAYYEDGWHSILNGLNRETVWEDMLSWVGDKAKELPSGADKSSFGR